MSQYGIVRAFLVNGRVASNPIYFPPHTKNGRDISAKATVTVMVNRRSYTDQKTNETRERKPVVIQIGGWGGVADAIARSAKTGQLVSCELDVDSFDGMTKIPQKQGDTVVYVPVMKPDGSGYFTEKRTGFTVVPGSLRFGEDSAKTIETEIMKKERPIGWNGQVPLSVLEAAAAGGNLQAILDQAKQGVDVWKTMLKAKNAQAYQGGPTFGNAKVIRPAGDVILKYPIDKAVYTAEAVSTVSGGRPVVDGFTYADMIAAGWNDEQLLTADGGKWAALVPKKAPAPPKVSTPPAPPAAMDRTNAAAEERQAVMDAMETESFDEEV